MSMLSFEKHRSYVCGDALFRNKDKFILISSFINFRTDKALLLINYYFHYSSI